MASSSTDTFSTDTVLSLRAQIKGTSICVRTTIFLPMLMSCLDNFRYLCPRAEGDPTVAIATDDDRYWVIVSAKNVVRIMHSTTGSETEEAALQGLAHSMAVEVWKKAKENGITLPK
jgi:hypothetical protein